MDLKEFVSTTLTQIVEGVAAAAPAISAAGGSASPDFTAFTSQGNGDYLGRTRDGRSNGVYSVSFDVAVTIGSSDASEGGGKLQVAGLLSLGGKVNASGKEETVSRLKFLVPLQLPVDPASRAAADREVQDQNAKAEESNRELREASRSPFAG